MSGIQSGDVVVCVDDGWLSYSPFAPRRGEVFRVLWRSYGPGNVTHKPDWFLKLAGKPEEWLQHRFRKIDPAEEDFTQLIRKMKPIKSPGRVEA